jgi:hypothetical protein
MKRREPFDQLSSTNIDEEAVSGLETSLISNSDLLSETTNSDIHKKYLEDQRLAQLELAEFEMIERDLDNIAVTPLLMSTDNFPKSLPSEGKTRKGSYENIHREVVNSEWSNKPADYYLGVDYSAQVGRNSHSRYQTSDEEDVHERDFYTEQDNEAGAESDHYGDYGEESESEVIVRPQNMRNSYRDEEDEQQSFEEIPSVALIADTHFIRVSQSQNPFLSSVPRSNQSHRSYEDDQNNLTQESIDDSVSWGNTTTTTPKHPAIRPKISPETSRKIDTPVRSRNSPAPVRYQTSNLSTGALGDGSSEWNQKRGSTPTNRKSSNLSTSNSRQSHHRKSAEISNTSSSYSESSKPKPSLIHDEDILSKAKKLEEEIASYQYTTHQFAIYYQSN